MSAQKRVFIAQAGIDEKLKGKKVMLPCCHYNRFAHTEDVVKIAKKITKYCGEQLKVDIDMNILETIAYWHDAGHCPYGHAGEDKLNQLINVNGDYYIDSFFSGYKHNILSAKYLLDADINVHWAVVDGVVKHSKTLPDGFNIGIVADYNLLRLNYIFRCDNSVKNLDDHTPSGNGPNQSWYSFLTRLPIAQLCCNTRCQHYSEEFIPLISKGNQSGRRDGKFKLCKENLTCRWDLAPTRKSSDFSERIACYLTYPHSLTYEGDIVRIADEISCLVNDLLYYAKALYASPSTTKEKEIVYSSITNVINILMVKCGFATCFAAAKKFLEKLSEAVTYSFNNGDICVEKYDSVVDALIGGIIRSEGKVESMSFLGNDATEAHYCFDAEKGICKPLLSFKSEFGEVFAQIKKKIYTIIHQSQIVMSDNMKGQDIIEKVFNYYVKNEAEFLKDSERYFRLDAKTISGTLKTLDPQNKEKEENIKRREIAFYIASLTEAELEVIAKKH